MITDLEALSAGVAGALDITGLGASAASDALATANAAVAAALVTSDANVVDHEVIAAGLQAVLDLLAVVSSQINGGAAYPGAGSATEPSVSTPGDLNTGIFFPAADVVAVATGGVERARFDSSGRFGLGISTPSGLLDVNDSVFRVRIAKTPASSTAAGNAGEYCSDANYFYHCYATNSWHRIAWNNSAF